ncbi:MAG: hypothetical protein ACRCYQ_11260 [Nocardioides sp.]
MNYPTVSVSLDGLVVAGKVMDRVADGCTASSRAVGSRELPRRAFGAVTHSDLIADMAGEFRIAIHARLRSSGTDADVLTERLIRLAADYREADHRAVDAVGRVLPVIASVEAALAQVASAP